MVDTMVFLHVREKSMSLYHGFSTCMGEIHERIPWFVHLYGRNPRAYIVNHGLSICTEEIHERIPWVFRPV